MEIQTTAYSVERLTNSRNGNPRYRLHTAHGPYTIKSDASCAYEVTNVTNGIPGNGDGLPIILKLTRAGLFYDIREA